MLNYYCTLYCLIQLFIFTSISSEELSLGTIDITAEKNSQQEDVPETYSGTVIYPQEGSSASQSVSELLATSAGVQIKKRGKQSELYIRGANANQYVLYIDGIPVSDMKYSTSDIDSIPKDSIERIEVYKGAAPAAFTRSAIGGIINIVTKKSKVQKKSLALYYGSYNVKKIHFDSSDNIAFFRHTLAIDVEDSVNDFKYKNNNGTPVVNRSDDYSDRRNNNYTKMIGCRNTVSSKYGNISFRISDQRFIREDGVPGLDTAEARYTKKSTSRSISDCTLKAVSLFDRDIDYSFRYYYIDKQISYSDPESEILNNALQINNIYGTHGISHFQDYYLLDYRLHVTLQAAYVRSIYEKYIKTSDSKSIDYPQQQGNRIDTVAETAWSLFDDSFLFNTQFRNSWFINSFYSEYRYTKKQNADRDTDYSQDYSWYCGLKLELLPDMLSAKSSVSKNFRVPDLSELFGTGDYSSGNSSLKPEHSYSVDGGPLLALHGENIQFRCSSTFFYTIINDVIIYIPNSQFTVRPYNAGDAEIYGNELQGGFELFKCTAVGGNYTYQIAKDRGDIPYYRDKYLPHRPVHQAYGYFRLFNDHVQFEYNIDYSGFSFRDRVNSRFYYVDTSIRHNASLSANANKELRITVGAENISDVMSYDVLGYPQPGRSYYGTVRYDF